MAYDTHARAVIAAEERQSAQQMLAFEQKNAAVMNNPKYLRPAMAVMHAQATVIPSEQVPYDRSICTVNRNTEAARMAQECRVLGTGGVAPAMRAPARLPATARVIAAAPATAGVIAAARVPAPARVIAAVPAPAPAQAVSPSVLPQAVESLVEHIEGGVCEPVYTPLVRTPGITDAEFKKQTGNAKRRHKRAVNSYNGMPPPKPVADDPFEGVV